MDSLRHNSLFEPFLFLAGIYVFDLFLGRYMPSFVPLPMVFGCFFAAFYFKNKNSTLFFFGFMLHILDMIFFGTSLGKFIFFAFFLLGLFFLAPDSDEKYGVFWKAFFKIVTLATVASLLARLIEGPFLWQNFLFCLAQWVLTLLFFAPVLFFFFDEEV